MARIPSNIFTCRTNTDKSQWWKKAGMIVLTPIVVFSLVFGPVSGFAPQTVFAQEESSSTSAQQTQQQVQQQGQQAEQEVQEGLDCSLFSTQGLIDCIIVTFYYVLVWPATAILGLVGIVFDFSLQINLANFGLTESFVEETWGITRDVANLFFIFILLYAGIATILQLSNIDTRRIIVLVILIAVLVNFSLFFTRVVIDVGNGLAMVFYESVSSGSASISEQYAGFLGVQELLGNKIFEQVQGADRFLFIPVFLAYTGIALLAAWVLAQVTALMFVRIAVLIFLMITAPIAFVAFIIPKTRNLVSNRWWGELVGKAFMPAIFLFFLFIIFSAGESFTNGIASLFAEQNQGVFSTIAKVLVQSSVLVAMLMIAKNVTVAASGQFGSQAASFGSKALGMAAGGAGGFVGRNTIGRGANRLAQTESMQRFAARSAVGERALRGMQTVSQASYDARGIAPKGAGLGKATGKGGYKQISEDREKGMVDFGKKLKGDVEVKTGEKDKNDNPITETISATEAYQRRLEKTAPVFGRLGANVFSHLTSGSTGAQHRDAAKKLGKEVKKKQRKETDEKTLDSLEKKYWGDNGSGGAIGGFVKGEVGGDGGETTVHTPEIKNIEYSDIVDSTGKPIAKETQGPSGGAPQQDSELQNLSLNNPKDRSKALSAYEEHLKSQLQELETEHKIAMRRLDNAREEDAEKTEGMVRRIDKNRSDIEKKIDDLKKMQRISERLDKGGDEKKGDKKDDKKE